MEIKKESEILKLLMDDFKFIEISEKLDIGIAAIREIAIKNKITDRHSRGESVKTKELTLDILKMLKECTPIITIAKKLKMGESTVSRIAYENGFGDLINRGPARHSGKSSNGVKFDHSDEILKDLVAGLGVVEVMKKYGVSHGKVKAVADKYSDQIPVKDGAKEHIGARFDGPLTKKVLAECERLGINRNDFLVMVAKMYFDKMDEVYGPP